MGWWSYSSANMESSASSAENSEGGGGRAALKAFVSAGRGYWRDVPAEQWDDWRWQLKNRITTLAQLERLLPTLTPEERAIMERLRRQRASWATRR